MHCIGSYFFDIIYVYMCSYVNIYCDPSNQQIIIEHKKHERHIVAQMSSKELNYVCYMIINI